MGIAADLPPPRPIQDKSSRHLRQTPPATPKYSEAQPVLWLGLSFLDIRFISFSLSGTLRGILWRLGHSARKQALLSFLLLKLQGCGVAYTRRQPTSLLFLFKHICIVIRVGKSIAAAASTSGWGIQAYRSSLRFARSTSNYINTVNVPSKPLFDGCSIEKLGLSMHPGSTCQLCFFSPNIPGTHHLRSYDVVMCVEEGAEPPQREIATETCFPTTFYSSRFRLLLSLRGT